MQTMADIFKLLLPVFLSPKNYDEMLKKLAAFLFYETWLMTFVLRGIPIVDTAFRSVESFEALGTALSTIPNHEKLNLGGFAVALLIAGLSYAIQLHVESPICSVSGDVSIETIFCFHLQS
jgi:hypothetical protein